MILGLLTLQDGCGCHPGTVYFPGGESLAACQVALLLCC